jgi:hypothetical protein
LFESFLDLSMKGRALHVADTGHIHECIPKWDLNPHPTD